MGKKKHVVSQVNDASAITHFEPSVFCLLFWRLKKNKSPAGLKR
jgi:hypothetical protein